MMDLAQFRPVFGKFYCNVQFISIVHVVYVNRLWLSVLFVVVYIAM